MYRSMLTLLTLAGAASTATAQTTCSHGPECLRELVTGSQLAFRGEVIDVRYANSLPAADAPDGIPHTYVTYRVDQVLRGVAPAQEVTLRFMGGWDAATQTFLDVSLSPTFDVGDEDFLFVRGNGELNAPLVGNRNGRLRISDGQVYSDTGREVRVDMNGHIGLGERFSLPGVGSVDVMGHTFFIDMDPNAAFGPSNAVSADALAAAAARFGRGAPAPASPFRSVVVGEAFESPFPAPAPMRETPGLGADEHELDAETIAEILADESGLAEQYRAALVAPRPIHR